MRLVLFVGLILLVSCSAKETNLYGVAQTPWPEQLGNHRAILRVNKPAEVVALNVEWRRHDRNPAEKKFAVIHEDGDTVKNIQRIQVNNERCYLKFGPIEKVGKYYFYYLPYEVQTGYGFYNKDYLEKESAPEKDWLAKAKEQKEFKTATLLGFESRTTFDSFYPMEVTALDSEKDSLLKIHSNDILIFPEDRKYPIRMLDEIPQKWVQSGPSAEFLGTALKNEYYAFQLGIWASKKNLEDVKVSFSELKNGRETIPAQSLTCFNTSGIDSYGKPFTKRLDVEKDKVQPLWIGVDIAENVKPGKYEGEVEIKAKNAEVQKVRIELKITNEVLTDRGDSELWRHSRLRWLNSTLGIDDKPTKPYKPIAYLGGTSYGMTGKTFTISENGFPGSLKVKEKEILNRPVSFVIETNKGREKFNGLENIQQLKNEPGKMVGTWERNSSNFKVKGVGTIESDGHINYKVNLQAKTSVAVKDIRLELPLNKAIARYMMGMDLPGTAVPKNHNTKWNGPHDSFWIGDEHAGIWCEFRGGEYHGPMLNLYRPEHPASWFNGDKGGFKIQTLSDEVNAVAYSGSRILAEGDELEFEWSMLLTPVKDINYKSQFIDRYYHNGGKPRPANDDFEAGVKVINVHHANQYNPHINYPFVETEKMKTFIDSMHTKGQKVKIYYTIRELTNYVPEIWALRSLGNEILGDGNGGGYPWLREHFVDGYRPQWYQWFPDKSADASVVNAPGDSRWYNYYIEGLKWLVNNVGIDGLYLDDVSYDRRTLKRIRKVLDNEKPGCLLDLHSNTGFSKGPATQYTEFFPYLDKLWFGESFHYDKMPPENWFVEVSGIPFGLMGDMLHAGGNRWLGMLFGMTVRHPWLTEGVTCDPRPIWKIWDEFKIEEADMVGFWESEPMVTTNNANVKVTAYKRENKILLSLGNFSDKVQNVKLNFQWDQLGLDKNKLKLYAPEIKDFQEGASFKFNQSIEIQPRKGWLIYLE